MRHLCPLMLLFLLTVDPLAGADWLDPNSDPSLVVVLNSEDNQFSFWSGPEGQEEWENNLGRAARSRIKGWQDVTGLKFPLHEHRGRTVLEAELHLARADTIPVFALVAATINTEWNEDVASWRWRNKDSLLEWTFPHSDFGTASFGNYGSLVSFGYRTSGSFGEYQAGGNTWLRMKLDPGLVHALILDQFGLIVTDGRGRNGQYNPRVYTRDQNSTLQPRLYIKFAEDLDTEGPGGVTTLSISPGPEDGEVILSFAAPSDGAFGYDIRYSQGSRFEDAAPLARWRIPRPAAPGRLQSVLAEGLLPGASYHFFVGTYDQAGNPGPVATVEWTLPKIGPLPSLTDGVLTVSPPEGRSVRSTENRLRYWACSEVTKVNPITGNRLADGYSATGAEDYKKANVVWDSAANRISLAAARNEVVGAQLILERLEPSLSNVRVEVSDLAGPAGSVIPSESHVEQFLLHYVREQNLFYADAAIPLKAPFATTFSIPEPHHNPGGVNQSVWLDLYVPKQAIPGEYVGQLTVTADQLSAPVSITLRVRVSPVTLPDYPTFLVDLNGYGNPWNYGSDSKLTALRYFQVCHKHRMVPNTLPYGWNGSVQTDRRPQLSTTLPLSAVDWSVFDDRYGWFLNGTAFSSDLEESPYVGPGADTPIATFYTPFFESWPMRVDDPSHGFDHNGLGHAHWNTLVDSPTQADQDNAWQNMPDIWGSFSSTYEDSVVRVVKDWFEHAQEQGWHQTKFQSYLNHKWDYNGCAALWTLEESSVADDFRAVGYFHDLYRRGEAAADAPDVDWHFRFDISTRWVQNFGQLDNRINLSMMNRGSSDWHWPNIKYRSYLLEEPDDWFWYGGGQSPSESNVGSARLFLKGWSQGLNGATPYWNNFDTSWERAHTLSVLYSGQNVPGHGRYDGPIPGVRMKTMRQAQQVLELLNLLANQPGWNRERVTRALLDKYGDGSWDRSFEKIDERALYQLRADLIAHLETFLTSGGVQEHFLPQVADSNLIRTTILLFNVDEKAKDVSIDVTDDEGNPLRLDLMDQGQYVVTTPALITLNPGATKTLETRGLDAQARTGAAYVSSVGSGLGVSSIFTILDGNGGFVTEAGIGHSTASSSFVMPVDTTGAFNSGVALFNPNDTPAQLEFSLHGLDGDLIGTKSLHLNPKGHLATFVAGEGQLFPQVTQLKGTLRVTGSQEFAAVVVRQNLARLNLTTLPAVPADSTTTDFLLPHFGDGPVLDGTGAKVMSMTMSFLLFNLSLDNTEVNLSFSDTAGVPVAVTIGAQTSSAFQVLLREGEAVFLETDGTGGGRGSLATGGARVSSDRPIGVSGIFTLRNAQGEFLTETGIGTSVIQTAATIVVDNSGSFDTGVAFFNPSDSAQDLVLRLYDEEGALLSVADASSCEDDLPCLFRMEPGAQMARFVWELFHGIQIDRGSLAIAGPVATMTLRQNSAPLSFTTMPVGEGSVQSEPARSFLRVLSHRPSQR